MKVRIKTETGDLYRCSGMPDAPEGQDQQEQHGQPAHRISVCSYYIYIVLNIIRIA